MRIIFLILSFFLYMHSPLLAKKEAAPSSLNKILFVTYDAGETYAFLPIIKKLNDLNQPLAILAMGTSYKLLKDKVDPSLLISFSSLGLEQNIDTSWPREKAVPKELLNKALLKLSPKRVITGAAAFVQGQIARHFTNRSIDTLSYFDSFSINGSPLQKEILSHVQRACNLNLVTTEAISSTLYPMNTVAVGSPSLDARVEEICSYSPSHARKLLNIPAKAKLIVFIGGYEPEYQNAFLQFLQAAAEAQEVTLAVSAHPKVDGSWEKAAILQQGLGNRSFCFSSEQTAKLVAAADLVICHKSTVGMQALQSEKPVLYFLPEGSPAMPFAPEGAQECYQKEKLTAFLHSPPTSKAIHDPSLRHSVDTVVSILLGNRSESR